MSTERNTKERQKITKRLVDCLAASATVWDAELTGFGVRRQRRDTSFVLKYSFRGRQRFYTLGRHGVVTVESARAEARRLLGLVASGIDPAIAREDKSPEPPTLTVKDLCELYLREGPAYKPDKRESSWYTDRSNIKRHIEPLIGQIDAHALDEAQVVNFVADVARGATQCDLKVGHRARAIVKGGRGLRPALWRY
jgi:hypothetical protein